MLINSIKNGCASSVLKWMVLVTWIGNGGCLTEYDANGLTDAALPDEELPDEELVGRVDHELVLWRDDHNGVSITIDGHWGEWRQRVFCNPGMWAVGYMMRVESGQGWGDDTALNSVRLLCKNSITDSTEWISSYEGRWGSWRSSATCAGENNFLNGARMRIESPQRGGDDTAANDVEFSCSAGGTIHAGGGRSWGSWRNWHQCPSNTAVCGLAIRFESSQGAGDDTAMNGLELECCTLP